MVSDDNVNFVKRTQSDSRYDSSNCNHMKTGTMIHRTDDIYSLTFPLKRPKFINCFKATLHKETKDSLITSYKKRCYECSQQAKGNHLLLF